MYKVFIILLLFINTICLAQSNSIQGKVVAAVSDAAIANASIFISNTSKGTRSAVDGSFSIADVPIGKYDLIISCVGYQTVTYSYTASQLPLNLKVEMEFKVTQNNMITVMPFEKNGWEKWGKTFLESYLGTTDNSNSCKILNKEVIKFRFRKKDNTLEVVASEAIIVENKALGYRIKHQLELFECDFNRKAVINLGYPLFELIEAKSNRKEQKYKAAREQAYKGSLLHLMRSFYNNELQEEGFVVRGLQEVENEEKKKYKENVKKQLLLKKDSINKDSSNKSISMQPNQTKGTRNTFNIQMISEHDRAIMNQSDYYEVLSTIPFNATDLLKIDSTDSSLKILSFPNKLYVEYKNEKQSDLYYSTQFLKYRTPYQTTRLFFVDKERMITIDANGNYYDALSIFLDGYIGWEKMGEMLPLDYQVKK
jgi:CarboxypepD_reg-like domain